MREERAAAPAADERVGLRDRTPEEPVRSRLQGAFNGWSKGQRLVLANGQTWRVTEGSLFVKSRVDPEVTIAPGFMGVWYLQVEGETPRAKVQRID